MLTLQADSSAIKTVLDTDDLLKVKSSEESLTFLSFQIAGQDELVLPEVFKHLETRKVQLGIENIQIAMSSLEDVFLSITKMVGAKESSSNFEVKLCTGETVQVPVGMTEPFITPQAKMVRVVWSIDDGTMTPVESVHISNAVTIELDVPDGLEAESSLKIQHSGQVFSVKVPAHAVPGGNFQTQIQVPVGPSGVSIDMEQEQQEKSAKAVEQRVKTLLSSYLSQSKAMFQKTSAIQRK